MSRQNQISLYRNKKKRTGKSFESVKLMFNKKIRHVRVDCSNKKASGNAFSVFKIESIEMVAQKRRDTIDRALRSETRMRILGSAGTVRNTNNGYTVSGKRTGRILTGSAAVEMFIADQRNINKYG